MGPIICLTLVNTRGRVGTQGYSKHLARHQFNKEFIHLRKNRFIFCAVKSIMAKPVKTFLENICVCSYHMVKG